MKEKLLALEEDFFSFKSHYEQKYKYFLILYFAPPLLLVMLLPNISPELYESLFIKIVILSFVIAGIGIHFFLKLTYYRTNKNYKNFIEIKFDEMKKWYSDNEEFKKAVVESAKEIFADKNQELSNITVKKSIFWINVFINIGIEFENE
jgi:hypothetical protein